ncbi:MAG TPA: tripartite tricarboxylate transporter TctB family protein [Xanthobacteraceae bacterium]|nr:tripartite tricarboxylate transporter TctB family protein [Xanthobacteraceae bacterium]
MALGRDGIAGLVCLAISIWLLVLTQGLPPALMVPIGPAFYPRVVLSIMAILSAMLVVGDLRARRAPGARQATAAAAPSADAPQARPNDPLVVATFVVFGLYVLLLPKLGFLIATTLFVGALQILLERPRSWARWARVILVALGTALACHLIFESYLLVLLPRGDWSGM